MNKIRFSTILLLIAALAVLTGCNKEVRRDKLRHKMRIVSVEGVSGNMENGWTIRLRVKNMTGYAPVLTDAKGTVYMGGRKVAHLRLMEEVRIPKRVESVEVALPVAVSLSNPLAALALVGAVRKGNYEGIEVELELQIRVMSANRTVTVERMPLKEFLNKIEGK